MKVLFETLNFLLYFAGRCNSCRSYLVMDTIHMSFLFTMMSMHGRYVNCEMDNLHYRLIFDLDKKTKLPERTF